MKFTESELKTLQALWLEQNPGRPIFNKMLERINLGEANGIICWKLDRLARNPVDGGQVSWMLQGNAIKHIQTYGRSYLPEDNVLMMSVELGVANQFVRDLSVNVKRGLRKKVQDGNTTGLVPTGYLNSPDLEKGTKIAIKDVSCLAIKLIWGKRIGSVKTILLNRNVLFLVG
ncbi:MAG TPA: recombinase family protein [Patescibacteria group bacterium]|nr:recombinase family protein [Patescibacteria group bacterium]